jgi:hypothetical protein
MICIQESDGEGDNIANCFEKVGYAIFDAFAEFHCITRIAWHSEVRVLPLDRFVAREHAIIKGYLGAVSSCQEGDSPRAWRRNCSRISAFVLILLFPMAWNARVPEFNFVTDI